MSVPSVRSLLPADFHVRHWRKKPLLVRGAAAALASLVTAEEIDRFEEDFFAAPPSWRTNSIGRIGAASYIGNGECINEPLARLCNRFRDEFQWPHAEIALVRNREATSWVPSGPHFDQVDNFVVQGSGVKQWRLWSTQYVDRDEKRCRVLRLPQYGELAIPPDASDLVEVTMEPGDLLYVPLFWGHSVRALGAGVMLSINLKALLPSQVLLRGMASRVRELEADAEPLPLPLEVADWDAEVRARLSAAFSLVVQRLAPAVGGNGSIADTAAAGVAEIASSRHQLLLKPEAPAGELRPSPLAVPLNDRLGAVQLDIDEALAFPPTTHGLSALLEALSLVHLHRFLSLVTLGPQPWWAPNVRDPWHKMREQIDAMDFGQLVGLGADSDLIELTTRLRDDLLAFNRRHAVGTLATWLDTAERVAAADRPTVVRTFDDAACEMPAPASVGASVDAALRLVNDVWPSFSDAFATLVRAVTADGKGRQAILAAGRARIAVVDPRWSVDQTAVALGGELGRIATQLIVRFGGVAPGAVAGYGGSCHAPADDVVRAGALVGAAAYVEARGGAGDAMANRRLAAELLDRIPDQSLTQLGRDLVAVLRRRATGRAPAEAIAVRDLHQIVLDIEGYQASEGAELVDGHTRATARFRWSDLRRDEQREIGTPRSAGMDCGISPWIV